MKILIISDLSMGGVRTHTLYLSKALSKLDHKVHVISYDSKKSGRVKFHKVPSFKIMDYYGVFFNTKDYLDLIEKIKPDVLHFHYPGGLMDLKMRKIIQATRVPSVLTLHIAPASRAMFMNTIISLYFEACKSSVKSADAIICVSNFVKKGLKKSLDFPDKKMFVIPNGVDTHAFKPIKRRKSKKLKLLFVGRLTPEKGAHHLFKIMNFLDGKVDAHLEIIGFGPTALYYKMKCHHYKNIEFIGKMTDIKRISHFYASSDFTMFTSLWQEPFGMVLTESMACGTPPIAYLKGAVPEIVKHGYNGFIVNEINEEAFANAIIKASKSNLTKIRENARKTALEKYSWPRIAKETVKVYRKVLRGL